MVCTTFAPCQVPRNPLGTSDPPDESDAPGPAGREWDAPSSADVSPPGDRISQIVMNWGQDGFDYNFGELLPPELGDGDQVGGGG